MKRLLIASAAARLALGRELVGEVKP